MTSPSPPAPHSSALRRLKAAHDAARAAEALKRGDRGKAAELYLSAAAAAAAPRSTSSAAVAAAVASERARALSNASAALCAAGRFKEALEAADEAVRLSTPEAEEEEEEEEEGGDGAPSSSSLALCHPPPPQQQPTHRQRRKGRQTLGWSKPHWRRGAALRGLDDHLAAALAFADAHGALEREASKKKGEKTAENAARLAECAAAVREAVFKGARCASDAASLLCDAVLRPAEEDGRLLPRSPLSGEGAAAAAESLRAAAAAVVAGRSGDAADESGSGDPHNAAATSVAYLSSLSRWLVSAPPLPQLLVERSCVFCAAGQWRAAVSDARRALELSLAAEEKEEGKENQPSTSTIVSARVVSDTKNEKENRAANSTRPSEEIILRPAPSDAAALALARALLARPGDEGGGGGHRDCRGAARVLAEGVARIRRRALSFSSSAEASSPGKEASSSRRERAASALAAPLVELLRKVQASEELPPGEVGEILLSSAAPESREAGGELPPRSLHRRLRLGFEFSDSSSSLGAGARSALLLCVSKTLRVPRAAVALEKVSRSSGGALSLSLSVSGASGAEEEREGDPSLSLESRLRSPLQEAGLFPESILASFYEGEGEEEGSSSSSSSLRTSSSSSSSSSSSALVPLPPPPPSLDLSLPLRPPPPPPPRLTDAAGRPLPPLQRHAFALSRVHYSSKDQSERSVRSWTDAPRLGLRWRQSAAEVSVVVASVAAAGLSAAEVEVVISPRRLLVASKKAGGRRRRIGEEEEREDEESGETDDEEATKEEEKKRNEKKKRTVFLDLALERMVVPDESTWTLLTPGGLGEEGLLVTLAKANVELFASLSSSSSSSSSSSANAPSPSLTWWPRLASRVDVPEISADDGGNSGDETVVAWDDYEKDYSDLPAFAAERVSAAEAALRLGQDSSGGGGAGGSCCGAGGTTTTFSGVVSSAGLDRAMRRSLACADDSRRRHRARRLREMRREVISRGEEAGRMKREEEEKEESL